MILIFLFIISFIFVVTCFVTFIVLFRKFSFLLWRHHFWLEVRSRLIFGLLWRFHFLFCPIIHLFLSWFVSWFPDVIFPIFICFWWCLSCVLFDSWSFLDSLLIIFLILSRFSFDIWRFPSGKVWIIILEPVWVSHIWHFLAWHFWLD